MKSSMYEATITALRRAKPGLARPVAAWSDNLREDEAGATATEYALIASAIAITIIAAVFTIDNDIGAYIGTVDERIARVMKCGGALADCG